MADLKILYDFQATSSKNFQTLNALPKIYVFQIWKRAMKNFYFPRISESYP